MAGGPERHALFVDVFRSLDPVSPATGDQDVVVPGAK
jgi:hypothetical protein